MTQLRGQLNGCRPNEPEPGNTGGGKQMKSIEENTLNFKSKSKIKSQILAEIAVFTALSTALSLFTFIVFPQGGSVTVFSMVPMLWLALRRGPQIGIFAGVVYGFVQLAVLPQVYYPMQILLDYPLAFGCIGLAGFFKRTPIIGVTVAVMGRLVMHLFSGAIFFAEFAPDGMNPWLYSTLYNASYMIPELVLSILLIGILWKSNTLRVYM